jgi:hypothetical protein
MDHAGIAAMGVTLSVGLATSALYSAARGRALIANDRTFARGACELRPMLDLCVWDACKFDKDTE